MASMAMGNSKSKYRIKIKCMKDLLLTHTGSLVSDTILGGTPFEAECFTAHGLFMLPQTTHVEWGHVVKPLGQSRHLEI